MECRGSRIHVRLLLNMPMRRLLVNRLNVRIRAFGLRDLGSADEVDGHVTSGNRFRCEVHNLLRPSFAFCLLVPVPFTFSVIENFVQPQPHRPLPFLTDASSHQDLANEPCTQTI